MNASTLRQSVHAGRCLLLSAVVFAVLPSCTSDGGDTEPAPSVASTTSMPLASTTTVPRDILVADDGRVTFDPAPQGFEVREDPATGTVARRVKIIAFGQRGGDNYLVAIHRGPGVGSVLDDETDRPSTFGSTRGRSYREAEEFPGWRLLAWAEAPDVVVYVNSTKLDFSELAAVAETITITR